MVCFLLKTYIYIYIRFRCMQAMGMCGGHHLGSLFFPFTVLLRIELRWADPMTSIFIICCTFTGSAFHLALRQALSCFYCCAVYSRLAGPELPADSPVLVSHLAVEVLGFQLSAITSCFYVGPGLQFRSPGLPALYFHLLSRLSDLHAHAQKRPESWRELMPYS